MTKKYIYDSVDPVHINLEDIPKHQADLLAESEHFCIYPWIHIHTYPTGQTYPCCHADMHEPLGSTKVHTLKELWNSPKMKELRRNMLDNKPSKVCNGCYEQENSGFFSGRKSANKHHGHHIARTDRTQKDGKLKQFDLTYWDTRFSNICNLSCRTCGHIFSSSWYKDQVMLCANSNDYGWSKHNKPLNIAGRYSTDLITQLMEHIDTVEQIYFAGGEPLQMHEHYTILDELVKRKRFNVRLIYNTNFTNLELKGKHVFEYWKQFDSVSIGASLDGEGKHAEYIRKGTEWEKVVENRKQMLKECPNVDFYISATLSIMNALHLPDFHKSWVKQKLINPQDFNINILQDPEHYRIDIATEAYKKRIKEKYKRHIKWLDSKDDLQRASTGYKSAINFLDATDNTRLLQKFSEKVAELDMIRKEYILDYIPELKGLNNESSK